MELVGIENEAEFYPAGTLSDVLKVEIQDLTSNWTELEDKENPFKRLTGIASFYQNSLNEIRNTKNENRKFELYYNGHNGLVGALGYRYKQQTELTALDNSSRIPLIGKVSNSDGMDMLWKLQAPLGDLSDESSDPLSECFSKIQFPEEVQEVAETSMPIEEILSDGIFSLPNSPRYVLIFALSQIVLIDKRKWPSRSVLRFDLQEIFSRNDPDTLAVTACLISREARVPEQGIPICDRIEEEAQRKANAVTTSLKRTVRDAIEILGQEVLDVTEGKYPKGERKGIWIDGADLSQECLRFMYRLLFLFYVEANPRLNILDSKNPTYMKGYSIEMLRELESVRLRTQSEREGTFLWESLQMTLKLFFNGEGQFLKIPSNKVSLLAPDSTPLLSSVKLRNEAVQKIIRLLSLKSSKKHTSRISYAKLGIGQLGAVYETLISFTGFVAKTDLIQIDPKNVSTESGDNLNDESNELEEFEKSMIEGNGEFEASEDPFKLPPPPPKTPFHRGLQRFDKLDETEKSAKAKSVNKLAPSYFVPRNRKDEFKNEDVVFLDNKVLVYPKGSFIYRLAGRDRERHASYYTPEPLARLLVRHALLELCKNLSADEILELKILEPAMGSAAFLVEATNQLADLYLERKQAETKRTIKQDQILIERQKVRAFIADRNCFGVDLNPIATELGTISLWLNGLHGSDFLPWFGDQLHAGNSLLGARRASYSPETLAGKTKKELWLNKIPMENGWKDNLKEGYVWQWLLPANGMLNYDKGKALKEYAGDASAKIKSWKNNGFFEKLEPHEIKLLQSISKVADELFERVANDLAETRKLTNDSITLWPDKHMKGNSELDFRKKAKLNEISTGIVHVTNTLPFKRLKTAMDAWCALWLWPIDKLDYLPTRTEFIQGMAVILEGGFMEDGTISATSIRDFPSPIQYLDLFDSANLPEKNHESNEEDSELEFQETNVEALIDTFEWLKIATGVAESEKFTHFDLIFADVLKSRRGFDLVLGNPPWAKPSWNESKFLEEIDPLFIGLTAADARKKISKVFENREQLMEFLTKFVSARGSMEVTSSKVMNPFLGGGSNNLYGCFIDLAFRLTAENGCSALIHQDGHLGDPGSGEFRSHWYRRITKHFHFINAFKKKNFAEVHPATEYSINIYRGVEGEVEFDNFSHAFLPVQIEESYSHDGSGDIPGIKDKTGKKWNVIGHGKRIVKIDASKLGIISSLTSHGMKNNLESKFYQPINSEILDIMEKISSLPILGEMDFEWQNSRLWDEANAQKNLKAIEKCIVFSDKCNKVILTGPMIFVGNPYYKIPRKNSIKNTDYDCIDLFDLQDSYIPRTKFVPTDCMERYRGHIPDCKWNPSTKFTDQPRFAIRRRTASVTERTLVGAIIPNEVAHVDSINSVAFKSELDLLRAASSWVSIPFDFLLKLSGKTQINASDLKVLPWIKLNSLAFHHILRLSCITSFYGEFWSRNFNHTSFEGWSTSDCRLSTIELTDNWTRKSPYRTDYERRMALVELDVLVAMEMSLTLSDLIDIYSIYFPIMQKYENNTWYDQNGHIVWTNSGGLNEVGWLNPAGKRPSQSNWEEILEMKPSELSCIVEDDTLPDGPRKVERHFVGPFDKCDRIEDYKRAWKHFEKLRKQGLL